MTTQDFPTLTFSVNRLAAAEAPTGKDIADIVRELDGGEPSLTTMRALVAAGTIPNHIMRMEALRPLRLDLTAAGNLIEKHGTRAASAAIGQAMTIFLADMAK